MISDIEQLMLEHFKNIPFHNLGLLHGNPDENKIPGGTCSDKTLSFLDDARKQGVDAFLHTAFIDGQEIHRLVRIDMNGRSFYADVGNGWPTLKLLPADEEVFFECYGMRYRTEIENHWVRVFHERQGRENLQMCIDNTPRAQEKILEQIRNRYSSNIHYPFSNSLRFSLVVGNEFLFLRGNRLERHSKSGITTTQYSEQEIPEAIEREFGFNVSAYFG